MLLKRRRRRRAPQAQRSFFAARSYRLAASDPPLPQEKEKLVLRFSGLTDFFALSTVNP
jgi:hypothetical protein